MCECACLLLFLLNVLMLIFIKCVKCSVNEDLTLFNQVDIEKKKQKKENVFSCGVCENEDFIIIQPR